MKHCLYLFSCILLLSIITISCEDEIDPRSSSGFEEDFYPTQIGQFWEYRVDSIVYSFNGSSIVDTFSFLREEVVGSYVDVSGDTISRIDRLWKRNLEDPWIVESALSITISGNQAIRTEDNLRFIKLVLPPNPGVKWNGNAFIDPFLEIEVGGEMVKIYKDWDQYTVLDRLDTETIEGNAYQDVVTVLLTDAESAIERRFAQEKYAKGIGLVEADYIILDTQCTSGCEESTWAEKAQQGFILRKVLINHN